MTWDRLIDGGSHLIGITYFFFIYHMIYILKKIELQKTQPTNEYGVGYTEAHLGN